MTFGNRLIPLLLLAASLGACGGGSEGESAFPSYNVATGVAADGSGNVYITGRTNDGLGGGASSRDFDVFVMKNGPTGTNQWTRLSGSAYDDMAQGVAVDNGGNVYLAGRTQYNPDNTDDMTSNLLLEKYDGSGNGQWYLILGADGDTGANAVAADNSGNIYVAGYTYGSIDGNPGAGGEDLFVAKVDGGGNVLWARQLGTPASDYAIGVAVDNVGNVYVAGSTLGGLDGYASAGRSDLFLVKYDAGGNKAWTRQLGTSSDDCATGVCTDGAGNVVVSGYTYGNLDGNTNAGNIDLFVVKYDSAGNKSWSRQMGTPTWDYANAVAADRDGNIYVGGESYGGLDGNTNAGSWDLVLVKFDAAGTRQWTRQYGTANGESVNGVVTDGTGNIYAVGATADAAGAGDMHSLIVKYNSAGARM